MYSLYCINKTEIKYFFWLYGLLIVGFGMLQINYSQQELFLTVNSFINSYATLIFKVFTFIGSGYTYAVVCLALLFVDKWKGMLSVASFALSSLIAQLIKLFFDTIPRPVEYFTQHHIMINYPNGAEMLHWSSFPSGHTTSAFSMLCLLALIIKNKYLSIVFAFIAFAVGISRVYLTAHFVCDTYFGMIIGVESTCVLYWLSEKMNLKRSN
jgi:membrane-associated phospholipid phosphatase